jgi:hypothetical protein
LSDETATTLVLVGAILQLIGAIFMLLAGIAFIVIEIIFGGWGLGLLSTAYLFVGGIIGLIFSILWLGWRSDPGTNKTSLIITGVIALILSGFLPGLLVLIGGAIATGESA